MQTAQPTREWVTLWRPPGLSGVEVYRGVCASSYPRYVLDDYKFGVMSRGAQQQVYRGERRLAPAGSLLVVQPGEVVSGSAVDPAGFAWRIVALEPWVLRDAAAGLGLRAPEGPDFPNAVVQDRPLALLFARLHVALEPERAGSPSSPIEQDRLLADFLAEVIARCARERPPTRREPDGDPAVLRAREYLQDHYAAAVPLDELALVAGAGSKFQLVRRFTREVGVPPHAYQLHTRVRRAQAMLAGGAAISDVALAVGFGNQSHLTRHFTPLVGVPPGAYRRAYVGDRAGIPTVAVRGRNART